MQVVSFANVWDRVEKGKRCRLASVSNRDCERHSLRENWSSWILRSWIVHERYLVAYFVDPCSREILIVPDFEGESIHIEKGAVDWGVVGVVEEVDCVGTAVKSCLFGDNRLGQRRKFEGWVL